MSEPTMANKFPARLDLEPGTYWWCECGKSQKQPFCDGSHAGSEFRPLKMEIPEKKSVALCQCKKTSKKPYCDGTHAKI